MIREVNEDEYEQLMSLYCQLHETSVPEYKGKTKELWQMEGRVERDIWYLEHWTFMLDLYIIYKTVKNAIQGEKAAY